MLKRIYLVGSDWPEESEDEANWASAKVHNKIIYYFVLAFRNVTVMDDFNLIMLSADKVIQMSDKPFLHSCQSFWASLKMYFLRCVVMILFLLSVTVVRLYLLWKAITINQLDLPSAHNLKNLEQMFEIDVINESPGDDACVILLTVFMLSQGQENN